MSEISLIEAVKESNVAKIHDGLASGSDIHEQDGHGWTPLSWAAGKGDVKIIQTLLDNGADAFKTGRDQRTPYMIALAAAHVDAVKLLQKAEKEQSAGKKTSQHERVYCKAYYLKQLRQFAAWSESKINWKEHRYTASDLEQDEHVFDDEDIVFIHQDYTVTQSMWHEENVIFNEVTSKWKTFCIKELSFKVPTDLDLISSKIAEDETESKDTVTKPEA